MSEKTHVGENQEFVVSCPLCRQNTTWLSNLNGLHPLNGGAHNLPNNPYALHMVGLLKKKQSEQLKL